MNASHNQFILLTGPPGVGKTTLIKKVCEMLNAKNYKMYGFFTEEVRENIERIGFDIILLSGQRGPLARITNSETSRGPKVGKYTVNVNSLESLCLPLLTESNNNGILVLDEVGKMELLSEKFKTKIAECFANGKQVILGTVPVSTGKPIPLVEKIKNHPNSLLITVDRANRNSLADHIVECVTEAAVTN